MAALVNLRIILGANNAERLAIESDMRSVEDLSNEIKRQFLIDGDIRLQYIDSDFDNNLVNLNQISDIHDRGTVQVICMSDATDLNKGNMNQSGEDTSLSSSTIILSSPDSQTARSQWPTTFQIPKFPYDVEMQPESANQAFCHLLTSSPVNEATVSCRHETTGSGFAWSDE